MFVQSAIIHRNTLKKYERYFTTINNYKAFYKTVGGNEGDRCYYPTRLDLYGKGCFYDCKYCYAKQMLNFRKLWNPSNVGVAPLLDVYKTINKIPTGSVVRLGGMTDCFQPIEVKYHNTYNTIRRLNKKGIHYLIVTKSDLIITEEYLDILDHNLAHIQISIPSTSDEILSATDNAPRYIRRKVAVETLYENGFDVSLRLSPFFFDTVDFDEVNSINVDKCLVEFLRTKPSLENELRDFINPSDYTVKEGGYRHLPLDNKLEVLGKLDFKEMTVCDDVNEHYDYFKENFNANKDDCCNLSIL